MKDKSSDKMHFIADELLRGETLLFFILTRHDNIVRLDEIDYP